MKLSKNFTLEEFTKSQTAIRHGFSNSMNNDEIEAAKMLCENVLQKVRDALGPTIITSGFRSKELNALIGGSSKSQHCLGEAADIEVPGISTFTLAEWIAKNCEFDQLILEFYTPRETNSGWVHVSFKRNDKNRKQILTAVKEKGRTIYKPGLVVA